MVCEYEAGVEARKAAAAARLRQGYRAEAQQREALQVKVGSCRGARGAGGGQGGNLPIHMPSAADQLEASRGVFASRKLEVGMRAGLME